MADFFQDALGTARQFQGLAMGAQQLRQAEQDQERLKLGTEALNRYRETAQAGAPDENALTTALIYNPDAAKTVLAHVGIQDQRQKRDAASFALRAATIADNPQQLLQAIEEREKYLVAGNRDPAHTGQLKQMVLAGDTEGAKKALKSVAAALVGDGSLDKNAYEMTFGKPPESLTEWQKANLALDKQRLGLEERRLTAMQSSQSQLTPDEKNWNRYQELLKTDPEQAKAFGRSKGYVTTEGQKLSVFDAKQIDTASSDYARLSSSASNYRMLADRIKKANLTSGAMGTLQEYGKELLGEQDTNTELRKAVAQVVNSEAMKFLPPGSTTEKELFLAREPMPTGKANSEYVARWLSAVANLNDYAAKYAEHKAQFISQHGGQRDPETGETVLSSWKRIQSEQAPVDSDQLFKDADAIIGGQ